MNAVQFGRWLADHRRAYGYRSQRVLVAKIQANPLPWGMSDGISEDFLARLEAGQLAHPFRGRVRRRVLALAWHLCKTPRDIKTYLTVAELTRLDAQEIAYIQLLQERLAPHSTSVSLPLPPRPAHLVGRSAQMLELVQALCATETGMCVVTGMPGVGKSALAYEALHHLASDERQRMQRFPDGIAAFTCVDRKGGSGLVSLLHDIASAFDPSSAKRSASTRPDNHNAQFATATAIDLARMTLAGKRALVLLDELDADFPLRQALDALSGHGENGVMVLATSRFVPAPALLRYHLHLEPLTPEAALDLLTILLGQPLAPGEDRRHAEQVCSAVGSLPLALELAAAAIIVGGIPLSLLAACLAENPLSPLLDSEYELRFRLAQAVESLEPELQKQFALLATLGVPSFGLESAAAVRAALSASGKGEYRSVKARLTARDDEYHADPGTRSLTELSGTAAALAKLVRSSLLDLETPGTNGSSFFGNSTPASRAESYGLRYRMHPLLRAHALCALKRLELESSSLQLLQQIAVSVP